MGEHRSRATPPRPPRRWRPWLAVLIGALALALGVAACGGGDQTSGVASLNGAAQTTSGSNAGSQDEPQAKRNWTSCMRQHGSNLPDPQITGNDLDQQGPTGVDRADPRLKTAEQASGQSSPPRQTRWGSQMSTPLAASRDA